MLLGGQCACAWTACKDDTLRATRKQLACVRSPSAALPGLWPRTHLRAPALSRDDAHRAASAGGQPDRGAGQATARARRAPPAPQALQSAPLRGRPSRAGAGARPRGAAAASRRRRRRCCKRRQRPVGAACPPHLTRQSAPGTWWVSRGGSTRTATACHCPPARLAAQERGTGARLLCVWRPHAAPSCRAAHDS